MRIAGAIILGVIGAILAFAVTYEAAGVDISMIGWIMMIGAGIWFLVELVFGAVGGRSESVETVQHEDGSVSERRQTTRRHDEPR